MSEKKHKLLTIFCALKSGIYCPNVSLKGNKWVVSASDLRLEGKTTEVPQFSLTSDMRYAILIFRDNSFHLVGFKKDQYLRMCRKYKVTARGYTYTLEDPSPH